MVHRRLRYMLAWTPRAKGNWPGKPRSASGSKPLRLSAVYSASVGTPLTVVGGCSRRGAARFSLSQRSLAAVSVTVAMAAFLILGEVSPAPFRAGVGAPLVEGGR